MIEQLIAPDARDHNAKMHGWGEGITAFRLHARHLAEVFPGFKLTVDEIVAEGDRVIAFWHFDGVHRGALWARSRWNAGATSASRMAACIAMK